MSVVRLTLLNGDPLDLYDKPSAVYPLTEGERGAGGKSIVLVRVPRSGVDRLYQTPVRDPDDRECGGSRIPSSRHALPRTT